MGAALQSALWWSLVAAVACLLVSYAVTARRSVVAARRRESERPEDGRDTEDLAGSRFTLPVSLIVDLNDSALAAAPEGEAMPPVIAALRSLLDLDYPQLELIAVVDGSRPDTLDVLKREFGLVPRQTFYRRSLPGPDVRAIYGSSADDRVLVVDQARGERVDSWNCGINISRYRYVALVPPEPVVARDCLLAAMVRANADPGLVVGILGRLSSLREVRTVPANETAPREGPAVAPVATLAAFDDLERLRDRTTERVTGADIRLALDSPSGFGLWRRDAVVQAGGFAGGTEREGLDLALRIRERQPCRILVLAEATDARKPATLHDAIVKRARWHRALLETISHDLGRLLAVHGARGLAQLASDLLPGACEAWLFVALPLCAAAGLIAWPTMLVLAGAVALAKGSVTNVALLVAGSNPSAAPYRPLRLITLGALEFPVYRPLAAIGAARGFWDFVSKSGPASKTS